MAKGQSDLLNTFNYALENCLKMRILKLCKDAKMYYQVNLDSIVNPIISMENSHDFQLLYTRAVHLPVTRYWQE